MSGKGETSDDQDVPDIQQSSVGNVDLCASSNETDMKRTATSPVPNGTSQQTKFKVLFERYYYQLHDGCGKHNCDNVYCASCTDFKFKSFPKDRMLEEAARLFKNKVKVKLCEQHPAKVARADVNGASCSKAVHFNDAAPTSDKLTPKLTPAKSPEKLLKFPPVPDLLTEEKVKEIIQDCHEMGEWTKLIRAIGSVFCSHVSLLQSFRKTVSSKEESRAMEVDKDKDEDESRQAGESESASTEGEGVDKSADSELTAMELLRDVTPELGSDVSGSTAPPAGSSCTERVEKELTVDLDSVRRTFEALYEIPDHPFQTSLINAISILSRNLEMDLRYHGLYNRDPNYINVFLIVMEIPVLHSPDFIDQATPKFCRAMAQLPVAAQARLAQVWSRFGVARLREFLGMCQQMITFRILAGDWDRDRNQYVNDDECVTGAARLLRIVFYAALLASRADPPALLERERRLVAEMESTLHDLWQDGAGAGRVKSSRHAPREDPLSKALKVNPTDIRQPIIPYSEFVNESLSDVIEMDIDFTHYKKDHSDKVSFMAHPFLLTTAVKNTGLYFDNRIRMINERMRTSMSRLAFGPSGGNPYLKLRIRRDHIIDDALVALEMVAMEDPSDLKKQLYVEFANEQGIDEGGVSKEFFQLVVEEIFNPDIGMFTFCEETQQFWFNPSCYETLSQFSLIGIVLGLAIYNNVILDIHFPMVVYRKLLGKLGTFEDLSESHPVLAQSLQALLDYAGDVEADIGHTFRVSHTDVFGCVVTHDLKPDGEHCPVTNHNRQEFVDLYSDYLLNESVQKQFGAFYRGFAMVTEDSPLRQLFGVEELELLVCGLKEYDFDALEKSTEYDGGFTEESQTIKDFWSIVHAYDTDKKRKLLQFTTGSDRVPVGGLAKLKLIIAKNGADSDRLPTSHTCFNVLLLPEYGSREKLEERLLKAISYAKGFGML